MSSTFSPNLRLELIATGEQQGTWGSTTNVNLGTLLEEAIGGYTTVTVSDSGDTTLTANNGSADQSRNMVLNLAGTISAARNVICPAIEKLYVVRNATTGGYSVTIKVSGQTGVTVPNGSTAFVYVNGTDAVNIIQNPVPVSQGGTGSTSAANARTALGLGTAATQNTGTSGANIPLLNGANTWSLSQTFSATSSTFGSNGGGVINVAFNAAANTSRIVTFQSGGSPRWIFGTNNASESGANSGSNLVINRYDDSGALLDTAMTVNRSTGVTSFKEVAINTPLAIAQGGTGATSNSDARTALGLGTIATQNANSVSITGGSISGITDLAVADGGTGASNAATARTNLGLGTTATQNANSVSITGGSISGITDLAVADGGTGASDAATARTNLGLGTIATQNANSVSITGGSISGITDLAVADGGTGASDASTARSNLGLGTIATQNANAVTITGGSVSGITDIAIADGGTGASTAASARTNLGLGTLATLSSVATAQITDANVTAAKLSGAQTGAAPIYGVRAWVVFDGTVATPTITASGNVTSVTKNGTGDYTINFTTALPNANYAVSITGYAGSGTGITGCVSASTAPTTGGVRVQLSYYGYPASTASAFATDSSRVSVMVLA